MEKFSTIIHTARENYRAWFSTIAIIFLLAFLFFIAGGGVSHSSRWHIENIEIKGAQSVSIDEIRSLVQGQIVGNYYFVYARDNSYLLPRNEIVQTLLKAFPRLARVAVERIDDHDLRVSVVERNPYALWCGEEKSLISSQGKDCWFTDDTGFIFDHAPHFSLGVYVEMYGTLVRENTNAPLRGVISKNRFDPTIRAITMLEKNIGMLSEFEMKPENELTARIYTSKKYPFLSGVLIRFKNESIPEDLVKNLESAIAVQFSPDMPLEKKLLYIDMRFGNKVIFGFETN